MATIPAHNEARPADAPRFRAANSNDAARARIRHDFQNVPACSFARGDGISHYLGVEAHIGTFPEPPTKAPAKGAEVPPVAHEAEEPGDRLIPRLMRDGFSLSTFLHIVVAIALGLVAIVIPEEATELEGVTIVTMVVEGTAEADAETKGEAVAEEKPVEEPVVEEPKPVIEMPPLPEPIKPIESAQLLDMLPIPAPIEEPTGQRVEDILTSTTPAEAKIDAKAQPIAAEPVEEKKPEPAVAKAEPVIEKKPEPVKLPEVKPTETKVEPEKKPEVVEKPREKKPDPVKTEKKIEKKKKVEKNRTKGNKGENQARAKKGETDARNKGDARSDASLGNSNNREKGNAAKSNYEGLVQKKLQRAKSRVRNPGKGSVSVVFTITTSGGVSNLRVSKSSGDAAVDKAALAIVNKAAPFPAIPAETGKKTWSMRVPITFK
ncbi:cell envelope integrity protein TolA [Rhizobium alvei]|uniref:TonB family protein n=1 Tax=Rhizobium alvei TaxID=1132659 RepID=A0ABT8YFE7_9HYPH|nr:TonB family protein [Rhizobium alvei]MDO6962406.1 TonB family protein [Rhizobium alvei]